MKNILITGGLGFIGSSLVGKLISSDYSICIIDKGNIEKSIKGNPNISSWIKKFDTSSDSYFKGEGNFFLNEDLLSTNLDKLISKSDVVIHLSANPGVQLSIESPELDLKENLLSTFKLIESIRKSGDSSKKIIFSSSAAPLAGNNTMPINENLPYKPLSPYGASKASSESYLQAYANAFSLKTLILRFSNIYGPGSILKGSVVANMIKSCINKSEINIYGDGLQTRDFVYIDDLINIIIFCIENHSFIDSSPIHVCSGIPTSIKSLANMIKEEMSEVGFSNVNIRYLNPLKGDARENYSSNKKLIDSGFPAVKKLSKIRIKTTIDFFLNNLY